MSILDKIEVKNELLGLIQKENFIGWIYSIDYEKALVISNDEWKHNVKGIPHNSFLIATSFSPDQFGSIDEDDTLSLDRDEIHFGRKLFARLQILDAEDIV